MTPNRKDVEIADFIDRWKSILKEKDQGPTEIIVNANDEKLGELLGAVMGKVWHDTDMESKDQWSIICANLRRFYLKIDTERYR